MTLIILFIVAIIVAGTWVDWKDAESRSKSSEWVSGVAMAGLVTACLTAGTFFFPLLGTSTFTSSVSHSHTRPVFLWASGAIVLCALGLAYASTRRRRVFVLVFLTGLLLAAFCLGFALAV